ncbi:MAG: phosphatidate cytidylyltransferase [Pseudomonadota bacterium]|nr:phosphatidate cytidylyltransferase [Pseudomonadota bacterium]
MDRSSASRGAARWADLRLRVLSAAVLAPLALGCIGVGGTAFAGLLALVTAALSYEWLGLCGQRSSLTSTLVFTALPLSVILAARGTPVSALILLAVATAVATTLSRGLSPSRPLGFGIPYLGLGALALVWLRQQPGSGASNVIVLLLVVWASDIGAYVAGRAIGGPRLAPSISPGKTWSGAMGGLVAAAAVGLAASAVLGHGSMSGRGMALRPMAFAILIGLVSQAGDLFESQLKRHFRVKDSGTMIPGHGGLLDRLDALLTAAPVAALLALVLGRGVVLWE